MSNVTSGSNPTSQGGSEPDDDMNDMQSQQGSREALPNSPKPSSNAGMDSGIVSSYGSGAISMVNGSEEAGPYDELERNGFQSIRHDATNVETFVRLGAGATAAASAATRLTSGGDELRTGLHEGSGENKDAVLNQLHHQSNTVPNHDPLHTLTARYIGDGNLPAIVQETDEDTFFDRIAQHTRRSEHTHTGAEMRIEIEVQPILEQAPAYAEPGSRRVSASEPMEARVRESEHRLNELLIRLSESPHMCAQRPRRGRGSRKHTPRPRDPGQ